MAITGVPLWLAQHTRLAGLPRPRARLVAALIAALLIACLAAIPAAGPPPVTGNPAARADDRADEILYEGIVEGLRHGGDYYSVTAAALRSGGYPLRPFVTFRLPTLAVVQSWVSPVTAALALYALAILTLAAWYVRLVPAFARTPPRFIATALAAAGMAAAVQPELVAFHEVWAGLLIALALAVHREDRWVEAVALGLAAMLVRETAALFAAVMAAVALVEGRRREVAGWCVAVAVLALAVACHASAVARVVNPLDQASPGWAGLLGFGFAVKALVLTTALGLAPIAVAAPLVGLALVGWAGWRDPLGLRIVATLAAYLALLSFFGRADTFYWALLVAPIALPGLAFAPDGLRELTRAALDRRRITVTRTAR